MLTVIQYYMIIKKTKTSRKDLKKEGIMRKLNSRLGKEQYFDTDTLQPNKTIIAKNINRCPNQNTCCIASPYTRCDYNYKSDSCIKAHNDFLVRGVIK